MRMFRLAIIILILSKFSYSQWYSGSMSGLGINRGIPSSSFGIIFYYVDKTKTGFYVDIKSNDDIGKVENFYDRSITWAEYTLGDIRTDEKKVFTTICGGLTQRIGPYVAFYAGMGFVNTKIYYEYHDKFEILGDDSKYWIDSDSREKSFSFNGGFLFQLNPLYKLFTINIGIETKPRSFTIGIGLNFSSFF